MHLVSSIPNEDVDIQVAESLMGLDLVPDIHVRRAIVAGTYVKDYGTGRVIFIDDTIVPIRELEWVEELPPSLDIPALKDKQVWKALAVANVIENNPSLAQWFLRDVENFRLPAPAFTADALLCRAVINRMKKHGYAMQSIEVQTASLVNFYVPDRDYVPDYMINDESLVLCPTPMKNGGWVAAETFERAVSLAALWATQNPLVCEDMLATGYLERIPTWDTQS